MLSLVPDIFAEIVPDAMLTGKVFLERVELYAFDISIQTWNDTWSPNLLGCREPGTAAARVLFDSQTRILRCLILDVADTHAQNDSAFHTLADTPVISGLLRLDEDARGWIHEEPAIRWLSPQADRLVCLFENCASAREVEFRLQVASDVFLLFGKQQWLGWAMNDPAAYIAWGPAQPVKLLPSSELRAALAAYYDLVKAPFEAFEAESPHILHRLRTLYTELASIQDPLNREEVLRDWIVDVTETFYYDVSLDT